MTESFTTKRVLNSIAVHKKQGARVLTALALLWACSLQAFAQNSVTGTVKDDTGHSFPVSVKTAPNGDAINAEGSGYAPLINYNELN
jgi:hypothetical protein